MENGGRSANFPIAWVPWAIVGFLVMIGGLTTLSTGLPWETKEHAADEQRLIDQRFERVTDFQQETSKQIAELTKSVADLTTVMARWQAAKEQKEKDNAQKKIGEMQEQNTRQRRYFNAKLKGEQRHHENEIHIDDEFIREHVAAHH